MAKLVKCTKEELTAIVRKQVEEENFMLSDSAKNMIVESLVNKLWQTNAIHKYVSREFIDSEFTLIA